MAFTAGETITEYISHIVGGSAVTGATFTVISARDPSGTAFTPTVTEIGLGVYRVTFSASTAGTWYLLLADAAQTPDVYYENTWDVDEAPDTSGTETPGIAATSGITRRELRRSIGRIVGDLLLVEATGPGSTTSIVDAINGGAANASHKGRVGIVSEGTAANLGRFVRVTDTNHTAFSFTFTPALPVLTATGDVIEFYNERDTGTPPKLIVEHINDVIRAVGFGNLVDAESDDLTWTSDDTEGLAVPAEWNGFYGVAFKDWTERWQRLPPADIELDPINRVVFLSNFSQWRASDRTVKLLGTVQPDILETDDAVTAINPEFLRLQAGASILFATAHQRMNSTEAVQMSLSLQARADAIRPKARRRPRANWVPLR